MLQELQKHVFVSNSTFALYGLSRIWLLSWICCCRYVLYQFLAFVGTVSYTGYSKFDTNRCIIFLRLLDSGAIQYFHYTCDFKCGSLHLMKQLNPISSFATGQIWYHLTYVGVQMGECVGLTNILNFDDEWTCSFLLWLMLTKQTTLSLLWTALVEIIESGEETQYGGNSNRPHACWNVSYGTLLIFTLMFLTFLRVSSDCTNLLDKPASTAVRFLRSEQWLMQIMVGNWVMTPAIWIETG